MFDTVIRGGRVIDGTGAEGFQCDIGITKGKVAEMRQGLGPGQTEIDATGLVVSPGFVDIHTHYDAQVFWDPMVSPSSLHGVTTIVGGNCGFSIAPLSGEQSDTTYLIAMLSRVEGMPVESLTTGVPWNWRSFGEYLDELDGKLAINTAFMVGHTALRRAVMHERAVGQTATDGDIAEMQDLLRESLRGGGLGLSSTVCPIHFDADNQPVPSRWSSDEELYALAGVVSEFEGTVLEFQPNNLGVFDEAEMARMTNLSLAADRPLNWNLLMSVAPMYERFESHLAASDHARERGGNVSALALCQAMTMRVNLRSGFVFDQFRNWEEIMRMPIAQRKQALADPSGRTALAEGIAGQGGMLASWSDLGKWRIEEVFDPALKDCQGLTIAELAQRSGKTAIDALLDLVVTDDLRTSLLGPPIGDDEESWQLRAESWRDPRTIIGGSDAGAHLDMLDTFAFSSMVLGEGVRNRKILTLENAVHQMTGLPAAHLGLIDRGVLKPGAHADITIFDPNTIGCGPVHTRHDLPGGAVRLFAEAIGVYHVFVNGAPIVEKGEYTGNTPGTVLRAGRHTRGTSLREMEVAH